MESRALDVPSRISRRVMMLVMIAAVLLTFGRLCRYEFITWDDQPYIARFPRIANPTWADVAYLWRHMYFTIYIPVTTTIWQLLGWAGLNPHVFHAVNVLVHVGSSLIVFALLNRLLRQPGAAWVGALVFALHPVQVETVGWVSGLKDLLAGAGSLGAMQLYLMAWDASASPHRRRWVYAASVLVLVLAMMSKPSAFTTPAVMWVVDVWLCKRAWRTATVRLVPWFLLAIGAAAVARYMQPPITGQSDVGYAAYTTIAQRPLIVGHTLAFYMRQVIWPAWLAMDYGNMPLIVLQTAWVQWAWLMPSAVLAVAAAVWRRSRVPLTAVAIFMLAMFHVLGWVPFDTQFFSTTADHYLYVAMLGPALLAGWAFTHLPARTGVIAAVLVVTSLGVRSFIQAGTWRDTRTVFEQVLAVNPRSWLAHCNLAQLALDEQDIPSAIEHCQAAIAAQPRYVRSYTVLAAALTKQNDFEGALHAYEAWVSILPEDPAALTYLGGVQAAMGDFAAAEKNLRHALANDPNYTTALLNYGTLLLKLDHPAAAEPYLRRAVQLAPQDAKSRWNLARCLAALGRREDAVTQLQIAYTRQANPAIIEMLRELGAGPSTTMPAP